VQEIKRGLIETPEKKKHFLIKKTFLKDMDKVVGYPQPINKHIRRMRQASERKETAR
jgi:hypothetical protein